jgi:hypothetical protein
MIDLLGYPIHDPDVVFTDLGLAALGAYLGRRLWVRSLPARASRAGAVLMGGLASAAFWGAIFHAFFPENTATRAGFIAWIPVALSIVVAAAIMLQLSLGILAAGLPTAWQSAGVLIYSAAFTGVVLLVDESFSSIVRFYLPVLALLCIAAGREVVRRAGGWSLILTGLLVSVLAALLQQARVVIHPSYFDHNALYHVVQSIALAFLYLGFHRTALVRGGSSAREAHPAARQG